MTPSFALAIYMAVLQQQAHQLQFVPNSVHTPQLFLHNGTSDMVLSCDIKDHKVHNCHIMKGHTLDEVMQIVMDGFEPKR